jgi:hypothetical protein
VVGSEQVLPLELDEDDDGFLVCENLNFGLSSDRRRHSSFVREEREWVTLLRKSVDVVVAIVVRVIAATGGSDGDTLRLPGLGIGFSTKPVWVTATARHVIIVDHENVVCVCPFPSEYPKRHRRRVCVCVCCEGMMRECLVWFWCKFKLPENVRKVCAWVWMSKFFVNVEGIMDISCLKSHMQVTCVRSRLKLTRKMDKGGEIESN